METLWARYGGTMAGPRRLHEHAMRAAACRRHGPTMGPPWADQDLPRTYHNPNGLPWNHHEGAIAPASNHHGPIIGPPCTMDPPWRDHGNAIGGHGHTMDAPWAHYGGTMKMPRKHRGGDIGAV